MNIAEKWRTGILESCIRAQQSAALMATDAQRFVSVGDYEEAIRYQGAAAYWHEVASRYLEHCRSF